MGTTVALATSYRQTTRQAKKTQGQLKAEPWRWHLLVAPAGDTHEIDIGRLDCHIVTVPAHGSRLEER